ncbi:MAG: GNAT family N-acetyltransferase [Acidimicrobiales bacterium]
MDGTVVGHVALHSSSSVQVMTLASSQTGIDPRHFGVIGRLFVAPEARNNQAGRSLLTTAATHAVARGLRPLLDVDTSLRGAIRRATSGRARPSISSPRPRRSPPVPGGRPLAGGDRRTGAG